MIGNIYYIIGILVCLSVISTILRFKRLYSIKEWKEKYEKIIGKKPGKKDFRTKKEYSLSESLSILFLFEIIWILFGFFTSNWYLFIGLILFSTILDFILKPIKFTLIYKLSIFTFILAKLCLYLYLIVNHFYLHQDTYNIVKQYLKW
jgi:hypothetical protein